mmetsp:Transcript_49633/g.117056  ORF Transcript_49633/g.117056 Transcript_49633/m.117056 type:complete len:192 (-) Transcript_49633:275-850(-)
MQLGIQLKVEPEVQDTFNSLQKALPNMHIPLHMRVGSELEESDEAGTERRRRSILDKDESSRAAGVIVHPLPVTQQLLENEDVASALLSLLPPAALAKVSQVCKSWCFAAQDERLWKVHCMDDPHFKSVMCLKRVIRMGGWRRFYCSRAKEVMLAKRLFPGKDQVTFVDIWMFTGEILWENLIEPTMHIIY